MNCEINKISLQISSRMLYKTQYMFDSRMLEIEDFLGNIVGLFNFRSKQAVQLVSRIIRIEKNEG